MDGEEEMEIVWAELKNRFYKFAITVSRPFHKKRSIKLCTFVIHHHNCLQSS